MNNNTKMTDFLSHGYYVLTAMYYVNTILNKVFMTIQTGNYIFNSLLWMIIYGNVSLLMLLDIKDHMFPLLFIHSIGVFSIASIDYWNLDGFLQNAFSSLQLAFDQTHQHPDNCAIHYFTIYMTWFALLGLLHRHLIYIDPFVGGCILYIKYNLVYYSVGDPMHFWIALHSTAFLGGSMIMFAISDTYLMNTKKYIAVLVCSIALQELSHLVYGETALMYQYDNGPFLKEFLLHGWFLIPLVMKWTL